jgi:hypothetical protein
MVTNAYHQADDREWTHDRKFEPSSRYKDGIDLDLIQVTDDDEDRTSHTNRLKLGTGESLKLTNTREIYNVNHKYVSQTTPSMSQPNKEGRILLALQALQNNPKLSLRRASTIYQVSFEAYPMAIPAAWRMQL